MTTGGTAAAALLLLFGAVTPALAQAPAKLIDAHDKDAVQPGPGIELGFYDPATGLFTRGMPPASTEGLGPVRYGIAEILILFALGAKIAPDNTLFIEPFLKMGTFDVNQFTANYYAEANVNFAVGKPDNSISVPFAYTPAGNSARMSVTVSAQVIDNNNVTHSFSVSLPLEPVPNGNFTKKVRITM
jgi:hypothetical protein